MRSHYNTKCSSFVSLKYHYFLNNTQAQWSNSSCLGTSLKFHNGKNHGFAFTTIHEQPFPFPHYYNISNLQSAPSGTQNQFCTHATFTSAPDVLAWPVPTTQPSAQMSIWPFSKSLHHFLSCCILIKPSSCTSINWW